MARKSGQGSKWLAKTTRTRIELRDGFKCVYCGETVLPGEATIDHVLASELGGSNDPNNLVTACVHCNSAKQTKSVAAFVEYLNEMGVDTKGLRRRVRNATRRKLPRLPRGIGDGRQFRRELAAMMQLSNAAIAA
jgi:hypothetical protein